MVGGGGVRADGNAPWCGDSVQSGRLRLGGESDSRASVSRQNRRLPEASLRK